MARQEALGLGSADADGSLEPASLAAGEDGVTDAGLVVPAGLLQARTAPPSEAAKARASKIRLNMLERSSVVRVPVCSGHLILGSLAKPKCRLYAEPVRLDDARPRLRCRRLAASPMIPATARGECNDRETSEPRRHLSLAPSP